MILYTQPLCNAQCVVFKQTYILVKGQRGGVKKEKNQFLLSQSVFQWTLSKPPGSKSLRSSGWIQTQRPWSLCCQSQGHSSTKLMPAGFFLWWKSPSARPCCWWCCSPSTAATWSTWSPSCRCSPRPGFSSCPQGMALACAPSRRDERDRVLRAGLPACCPGLDPAREGLNTQHKEKHLQTQGASLQGSSTSAGSAFYLGVLQGNEQLPFHSWQHRTQEVGWSGV